MGRPKSSYFLWILGHVLRSLFVLLVMGICTFLLWRMLFSGRAPRELRHISSNEVLREAYAQNGTLTVLEQPTQTGHTEAADNYAHFRIDWCLFLEEADQVQLLFFYNNSTLEHVSEKLGIEPSLPRAEEVFGVELVLCTEVEGEVVERVIAPTACEQGENSMYSFFKYTFDGVDIAEDTAVIYFDIFYEAEEREALGTMRLYHRESHSERRELTAKEERIIKE